MLKQPSRSAPAGPQAGIRPLWVTLAYSMWLAVACNLALWRQIANLPDLSFWQATRLGVALAVAMVFAMTGIFSLFCGRFTLKPVIVLFLVAGAIGNYFMLTYNIVIDKTMMVNTLQTDLREMRDLLSWWLLLNLTLLAGVPAAVLMRLKLRRRPALRQAGANLSVASAALLLLLVTVLVAFSSIASAMRNHPHVRYLINPLNSFYGVAAVAARPFQRKEGEELPLGEDAKPGMSYAGQDKPPLVVLVLGETARAGNFALNGYKRPTNPELSQEDVASQRNAWSCGTSTAASVPCMFSHLGREAYDARSVNHEDLLDVLQRAGLAVLWIDNQSGCKGTCDRIPTVRIGAKEYPDFCPRGECFDEVMLQGIGNRIAALPAERRARGVVVVLHQMGGHGPAYYQRSPEAYKKFKPECTSNALQSCDQAELINAYDNSIVYTDHVLAATIGWLKTQAKTSTTAMVYVADHGESLGEDNLYLHGMPYGIAPDVQKRVPWITWLSPDYTARTGLTTACIKGRLDQRISHDNYFHSVLGMLDIDTSVYKRSLDIYAPCSTHGSATPTASAASTASATVAAFGATR